MSDRFATLPPLRDVIRDHGLRAEKSLGQNFLLDQNITDKIVRLAQDKHALDGVSVIEIGPGPGGLTRSLLKSPAVRVVAIEYDRRAVVALESLQNAASGRLDLVQGDALDVDPRALCPAPRAIIANLPYNISTPLLVSWLSHIRTDDSAYSLMALMFQREVADRILAGPGSKTYGRLSVMCQWLCQVEKLYDLPPSAFTPPPKVSSAVVGFLPRPAAADAPPFDTMEKILAAAFGQRRKMIRSSLKDYLPVLEKLGIDPTLRAEDVGVADYIRIARGV